MLISLVNASLFKRDIIGAKIDPFGDMADYFIKEFDSVNLGGNDDGKIDLLEFFFRFAQIKRT